MILSPLKPPLTFPTLTGSIVTFNAQYALPLKSHTVALTATQSGSGTPSPNNVRPISGWSAIHIGNISDNTNINFFQGLLNGTYGFVDLGSLTWYLNTSGQFYTAQTNPTGKEDLTGSNLICSDKYTGGNAYTGDTDKTICIVGESLGRIWIKDSDYSDVTVFKNSLSGIYLIYELKTQTTPSFTNAQFEALCEAFGMNGQYAEIQIGSTVYGGEYDARTGVLTVTHQIKSIDSSTSINHGEGTNVFYVNDFFDMADDTETTDCNCFIRAGQNYYTIANVQAFMEDKAFACAISVNRLFIKNNDWSSLSDFLTWLGNDHIDIAVKLATPIEIQLPPCPIDTIANSVNNIWADTGNSTIQYPKFG